MRRFLTFIATALMVVGSFAASDDKITATHKWVRDYVRVQGIVPVTSDITPLKMTVTNEFGIADTITINFRNQPTNMALRVTASNDNRLPVGTKWARLNDSSYVNLTNLAVTTITRSYEKWGSIVVNSVTNDYYTDTFTMTLGGNSYRSQPTGVKGEFNMYNVTSSNSVPVFKLMKTRIGDAEKKVLTSVPVAFIKMADDGFDFWDLIFPKANAFTLEDWQMDAEVDPNPSVIEHDDGSIETTYYWVAHYFSDEGDCDDFGIESITFASGTSYPVGASVFTLESGYDACVIKGTLESSSMTEEAVKSSLEAQLQEALGRTRTVQIVRTMEWQEKVREVNERIVLLWAAVRDLNCPSKKETVDVTPPEKEPESPVIPPPEHIHSFSGHCGYWKCSICKYVFAGGQYLGRNYPSAHNFVPKHGACKACSNALPTGGECGMSSIYSEDHGGWYDTTEFKDMNGNEVPEDKRPAGFTLDIDGKTHYETCYGHGIIRDHGSMVALDEWISWSPKDDNTVTNCARRYQCQNTDYNGDKCTYKPYIKVDHQMVREGSCRTVDDGEHEVKWECENCGHFEWRKEGHNWKYEWNDAVYVDDDIHNIRVHCTNSCGVADWQYPHGHYWSVESVVSHNSAGHLLYSNCVGNADLNTGACGHEGTRLVEHKGYETGFVTGNYEYKDDEYHRTQFKCSTCGEMYYDENFDAYHHGTGAHSAYVHAEGSAVHYVSNYCAECEHWFRDRWEPCDRGEFIRQEDGKDYIKCSICKGVNAYPHTWSFDDNEHWCIYCGSRGEHNGDPCTVCDWHKQHEYTYTTNFCASCAHAGSSHMCYAVFRDGSPFDANCKAGWDYLNKKCGCFVCQHGLTGVYCLCEDSIHNPPWISQDTPTSSTNSSGTESPLPTAGSNY